MATIKKLQTLFSQKGMNTDERHEMIFNFTGGRTESSRELTPQELEELCNALQGVRKSRTQLMSECLKILQAEGIHRPDEPILEFTENGAKPNPWGHLNRWMNERSVYKKALYLYNVTELEQLKRQLYQLADNNAKSAQKPINKAWWRKGEQNKNLN